MSRDKNELVPVITHGKDAAGRNVSATAHVTRRELAEQLKPAEAPEQARAGRP